jgi:hypothetical protein
VKGRVLHSRVLLDGQPVPSKDFGALVPVDPGAHAIEVETDGAISQKKEVTLAERGYETITLEIQDKEKPATVPTAMATATATETAPPPPPPPPSKLPAFVLGGAGAASLIGAGVFYGLRVGALGELSEKCPELSDCPAELRPLKDNAETYTIAAGVLVGVGAAALAGAGAYWFFTQRKPTTRAEAVPVIGVGVTPGGIRVTGRF